MNLKGLAMVSLLVSVVAASACRAAPPASAPPPAAEPVAAARPSSVAEIANYRGPDRQQILEEGAKKEGKLMLYTSSIQPTKPLLEGFMQKYPFIQAEQYRADGTELVQKATEEYKGGKYQVDVWETTASSYIVPGRAGLLAQYWSPHMDKIEVDARDKHGFYVGTREAYNGLGYNTNLISRAEAPGNSQDLLNPRWKGQMAVVGGSVGPQWLGALLLTFGEDFVRRLAQQGIQFQNVSANAMSDMVVSGEVPLSPTITDSQVVARKEKGAPVVWVPLEPVMVHNGAAALGSKAPHPHAAMLYIDFLLSEEGQNIYISKGYGSPRLDMGGRATYKKIYLESQSKDFIKDFEAWQRLLRDLFARG